MRFPHSSINVLESTKRHHYTLAMQILLQPSAKVQPSSKCNDCGVVVVSQSHLLKRYLFTGR